MVRRYTPAGTLDREIAVPAKNPTCPAFGGRDLTELYVTSARQEMTPEELAARPDAGGVYRRAARRARVTRGAVPAMREGARVVWDNARGVGA